MMKYKFTGLSKKVSNVWVNQIEATEKIVTPVGIISPGECGGWIECEDNLSQCGRAWVSENAIVYGKLTRIMDDAVIAGYACVCGDSFVSGTSIIDGHAIVIGAKVLNSYIGGNAHLSANGSVLTVADNSVVNGNAQINNRAYISGGHIYAVSQVATFTIGEDVVAIYNGETNEVWMSLAKVAGGAICAKPYYQFMNNLPNSLVPYANAFWGMINTISATTVGGTKNFRVPVVWSMMGYVNVRLNTSDNPTMADAIKYAKEHLDDFELPCGMYMDDSFEVDENAAPINEE